VKAIRKLSVLAPVVALSVATGCLSKPAMVSHSFSIDPPAPQSAAAPAGVVLALPRVEVMPPYSGQSLIYRTGEHGLGRDPYARFAAPPSWLLTAAIRGYLANADFVRDVVAPGADMPSQATVEVAVSRLEGELHSGGSSAVLTLRFRVVSSPGGATGPSEILLKTYSKTIPIPRSTAKEIVNGWNQGLAEIMAEFQADLRGSLDAAGVPFSGGSFPEATPRSPTRR
jgi:ABC-type transport auxiliary lipoprotein component